MAPRAQEPSRLCPPAQAEPLWSLWTLNFSKWEIKHANLDLNEETPVVGLPHICKVLEALPADSELVLLRWHVTGTESRSFPSFPREKSFEACSYKAAERRLCKIGRDNGSGQEGVGHPASPSHQHPPQCFPGASSSTHWASLWVSLTHYCGKEQP